MRNLTPAKPRIALGNGTLVPAYFGPWQREDWATLLEELPEIVVINPASGAGQQKIAGYRPLATRLKSAGSIVAGYVPTSWGGRSISDLVAEVELYQSRYSVNAVFLDEIDLEAPQSWFRSIHREISGVVDRIICNPGRAVPGRIRSAIPDATWVTFEGTARQYLDLALADRLDRGNSEVSQAHLVHSISSRERPLVEAKLVQTRPDYRYLTSDKLPNPWDLYQIQNDRRR